MERQIRLWHDLCKKECCYLDATGTIIANWYGRRVLYYPLVIRHPVQGIPSIPVAELITSCHQVHVIQHFVQHFRRHEAEVYGAIKEQQF